MTGEGKVVSVAGDCATVRIEKKSACSGECSSCGLCSNPVYDMEVRNSAGAQVGDTVKLYMPSSKVYKAAFMVYMLPVITLFAVLGVCKLLSLGTVITVIIAIAALVGWVFVIRRYSRFANLENEITEIVK